MVIAMTATTEQQAIDRLRAECSESALFRIAVNDAIAAMLRRTVVGLSVGDAITALDHLRRELEEVYPHDRPRQILRIRTRRI
jgi:hypothetical protein